MFEQRHPPRDPEPVGVARHRAQAALADVCGEIGMDPGRVADEARQEGAQPLMRLLAENATFSFHADFSSSQFLMYALFPIPFVSFSCDWWFSSDGIMGE